MKYIAIILFASVLSACAPSVPTTQVDQCLRQELFEKCMKSLPAGPVSTQYNDWDEVVAECSSAAYLSAIRRTTSIKEECRGQ